MSVFWLSFCVFGLAVAFSWNLRLLLLTCSWAFSCIADETHSFIGVSPLSLLIASRSWFPSSPATWLVGVFSFGVVVLGLFMFLFPSFFAFFAVVCVSIVSGSVLSPMSHLLRLQLS